MIIKKIKSKISDEVMSAIVYLASSMFAKGLALITVPIFTRLMTPEQVGIVNLFTSWYAILSGISTLGLTSGGLMMSLNRYSNNQDDYLSSILTLTTGSGIAFLGVFVCFPEWVQQTLKLPPPLIWLMCLCFIFCPAYDLWLAKQRFNYEYKISGTVMTLSAILGSLTAVMAVINLPGNASITESEARLFGLYVITIGVAAIIWWVIFSKGKTFIHLEYWKYSLALSLPLIGQMLAAQVLGVSDRIMIEHYCGAGKVGIYSTVYTVGILTTMLWTAVNGSYTPYVYKNIKENASSVRRSSMLILMAFSIISLIIVLLGPEITKIIGTEEYYEGVVIIPPVAAGVYLVTIGDLYSDLLIYAQKTRLIMYGTVFGAAINIILNILLVPRFGYVAAAYTTMTSYIAMAVLLIVLTNMTYRNWIMNVSDVLNQRRIIILSVMTVFTDVLAIFSYTNTVIRLFILVVLITLLIYMSFIKDYLNYFKISKY